MANALGTPGYENPRTSREPLLDVAEVRRWLGVSRSSVYRLLDAGALTPIYLDSRPRFDPADVERLIESRRRMRGGSA